MSAEIAIGNFSQLRFRADAEVPGGHPDFDQEGHVGASDKHHRAHEEQGDRAGESGAEERVGEQCDYDERNQDRRATAHRDSSVNVSGSLRKHLQVIVYVSRVSRMPRELVLQMSSTVHSARQATREDVQGCANAGQQEYRREGRLNEMGNVHGFVAIAGCWL
jgi:hypothetical protein